MWAVSWLLGCGDSFCPPDTRPDRQKAAQGHHVCVDSQGRPQGLAEKYAGGELVARGEFRDGRYAGNWWKYVTDPSGEPYQVTDVYLGRGASFHLFTRRSDGRAIVSMSQDDEPPTRLSYTWYDVDGYPVHAWKEGSQLGPDRGVYVRGEPLLREDGFELVDVDPARERAAWLETTLGDGKQRLVDCSYPGLEGIAGGATFVLWDRGQEERFEVYAPASRLEDCTSDALGALQRNEFKRALAAFGLDRDYEPPIDLAALSLRVEVMEAGPFTEVEPTLFDCPCLVGRWQGKQGLPLVYSRPPAQDPGQLTLVRAWQEGEVTLAQWRAEAGGGLYRHGFVALR
jgi:hypothetical protein